MKTSIKLPKRIDKICTSWHTNCIVQSGNIQKNKTYSYESLDNNSVNLLSGLSNDSTSVLYIYQDNTGMITVVYGNLSKLEYNRPDIDIMRNGFSETLNKLGVTL